MNNKLKKIIFFICTLVIFLLFGYLFSRNTDFYNVINKPFFAPKGIVFSVIWSGLYIIQAYYITYVYFNYKDLEEGKKLFVLLIINAILNILYMPVFFIFKSLFGGFVINLCLLISQLLIIYKSKQINIKILYLQIPYLLWLIFALVLSISIYLLN